MKTDLRALVLVSLAACAPEDPIALLELGLGVVPDRVQSLTVTVVDVELEKVVATATAGRDRTTFALGVPAERLLEIRAVARTDRPGPKATGDRMPAFVARARRSLRLGRERQKVSLTAIPAGVLTFALDRRLQDPVRIRFIDEAGDEEPVELVLPEGRLGPISLVMPAGRVRAELVIEEGSGIEDVPELLGGAGLYVVPEVESVAVLGVRPPSLLEPEDPRSLSLDFVDAQGRYLSLGEPIETSTAAPLPIRTIVNALDAEGNVVAVPRAMITERSILEPGGRRQSDGVRGLPATLTRQLVGTGRWMTRIEAILPDGRTLTAESELNFLPPSVRPGPALRLELEPVDLIAITFGTGVRIRVLDGRSLLTTVGRGRLDLAGSDLFVDLPEGRSIELDANSPPRLLRQVSRPSGPRGLPVRIRATLTSTSLPSTLTATVVLPVLELPR